MECASQITWGDAHLAWGGGGHLKWCTTPTTTTEDGGHGNDLSGLEAQIKPTNLPIGWFSMATYSTADVEHPDPPVTWPRSYICCEIVSGLHLLGFFFPFWLSSPSPNGKCIEIQDIRNISRQLKSKAAIKASVHPTHPTIEYSRL